MEINLAVGTLSLKRLRSRDHWWVKSYDFLRYDIPAFCRNIWHFKKALWRFRSWDSRYNLELLRASLELTAKDINTGNEEDNSRNKKVAKIKRAIELLGYFYNDDFINLAEKELGKLPDNEWSFPEVPGSPGLLKIDFNETAEERELASKIFSRSHELEAAYWKELWSIIAGPDSFNWTEQDYDNLFDGSDMRGWWN